MHIACWSTSLISIIYFGRITVITIVYWYVSTYDKSEGKPIKYEFQDDLIFPKPIMFLHYSQLLTLLEMNCQCNSFFPYCHDPDKE